MMIKVLALFLLLVIGSDTLAEVTIPSGPLADLQQQINNLRQGKAEPVIESVNCQAGESITDVLLTHEFTIAPLVIQVSGVCEEAVSLNRNNVTLTGVGDSSGVTNLAGVAVNNPGFSRLVVENLTIQGTFSAMLATAGSQLVIENSVLQDSDRGLTCAQGATCVLRDSEVLRNFQGLCVTGGTVVASGTLISENSRGANVFSGGVLRLNANPFFSDNKTVVRSNTTGVNAFAGGSVNIQRADLLQNIYGVISQQNSHVRFESSSNAVLENIGYDLYVLSNSGISNEATNSGVTLRSGPELVFCTESGYIQDWIAFKDGNGEAVRLPDQCLPN